MFRKIQIVIYFSVAQRAMLMGRSTRYQLDLHFSSLPGIRLLWNSLAFVQLKYQITLRLTFSVEGCPQNLLMFAASDYSIAREGQKENLIFFPVDLWKVASCDLLHKTCDLQASKPSTFPQIMPLFLPMLSLTDIRMAPMFACTEREGSSWQPCSALPRWPLALACEVLGLLSNETGNSLG